MPRTQNQRSKVIDRKAKPGSPAPRQASPRNARLARNDAHNETPHVHESIAQVVELDQREQENHGFSERLAHRIALFGGSMLYVWLHVIWFAFWIAINVTWFGFHPFDPFPFGFLTMIVSLEAIFLATFVLLTENRQSRAMEKRAKIDLQINLIAEREITKVIEMLAELHEHLGIKKDDHEVDAMLEYTRVEQLADAMEAVEVSDK